MPTPTPPAPMHAVTTQTQPEGEYNATQGEESITVVRKGLYDSLKTEADALTIGTSTESATGLHLSAINLSRTVGALGILRLTYSDTESSEQQTDAEAISVTWQMKHAQKLVPIWRYCGPSAQNANRARISAWMREPDADLYGAYRYRTKNGTVVELVAQDQLLAAKIRAGIEQVMRFYPTVQKTTHYTKGKITGVGIGLAYIDTPGSPWDDASPGGSDMWLKVGDDVTRNADGSQQRVETWIGEENFDANLYGDLQRWEFGTV